MSIRILDEQALDPGGGVELLIGRDQGDRSSRSGLEGAVGFERSSELQGIIGAQPVSPRQEHRISHQWRGYLKDAVALGEVATKVAEDRPGLSRGESAAALSPGQGGGDLDCRDTGEINHV